MSSRQLVSQRWTMAEIVRFSDGFTEIVDHCAAHRQWYDDFLWEDEVGRRVAAVTYLREAAQDGLMWTVWDGANLVGVVLLNEVRPRTDAKAHFLFFDRQLSNKVAICWGLLGDAFRIKDLQRISVEVPTYASALASFVRKRLEFKYELEGREIVLPYEMGRLRKRDKEAYIAVMEMLDRYNTEVSAWAARKYRTVLYKGSWHDTILLSMTREEYNQHERSFSQARRDEAERVREHLRTGELRSGAATTDAGGDEPPSGGDNRPPAVHEGNPWDPAAERTAVD